MGAGGEETRRDVMKWNGMGFFLTRGAVVVASQNGLRVGAEAVPVGVCAAVDSGSGRC